MADVPRPITADDPEPPVGSVVLDRTGDAWLHYISEWVCTDWNTSGPWADVLSWAPLTLLWVPEGGTDG